MPPEVVRPPLPMIRLRSMRTLKLWLPCTNGWPRPMPPAKMPPLFSSDVVGDLQVVDVRLQLDAAGARWPCPVVRPRPSMRAL